ncbi:Mu transposase C-terminal domain-containing protein [Neobacillus sp. YIM B06451]|uniref:Mu transposase C-terminal domain-containing protein n=1 Tax=Neobacillus sp. YIM B06451 TaxID=3070994 RepID=UPI00292F7A4F|nr:Mu transposase C-terminal domain-containing protein [Neobacillus sp. YIM B06451]
MFTFRVGIRFLMEDNEYQIRNIQGTNIELENLCYNKLIQMKTLDELLEKWQKNELIFKRNSEKKKNKNTLEEFSLLPEKKKEEARRRYKILKPVLDGEVFVSEINEYLRRLEVGRTQFYVWKKKWEEIGDIRGLVSGDKGPKTGSRNKVVVKMIEDIVEEFCYSGENHTDVSLHAELALRIKETNELREKEDKINNISISQFRREKKKLIDQYRVDQAKLGSVEAKRRKVGTTKEVLTTRPLERVEIDWTPAHMMLINPATGKAERPTFIYGIDKYTGYPLGFYFTFDDVNTAALKQCLLHIIMPKHYIKELYPEVKNRWITYGKPEVIVLDNASVNESLDFEDACLQLGIEIQYTKVASGNQKGTIERGFRTLNDRYFHSMFGTTFSNPQEKGLYDSQGKACITINTFIYMVHLMLVDDLAQSYSEKRKGTPADLWAKALEFNPHLSFPLTQTVDDLKLALMSGLATRKVQESGVMIEKEYYNSSSLMELRSKLKAKYSNKEYHVRVRYDLADMREVYVWDEFKGYYIKAIQTGIERRGITYPEHILERKLEKAEGKNPNPKEEILNKAEVRRKILNLQDADAKASKRRKANKSEQVIVDQEIESVDTDLAGISGLDWSESDQPIALVAPLKVQTENKPDLRNNRTSSSNKIKKRSSSSKDRVENIQSDLNNEDTQQFIDFEISLVSEGLKNGNRT